HLHGHARGWWRARTRGPARSEDPVAARRFRVGSCRGHRVAGVGQGVVLDGGMSRCQRWAVGVARHPTATKATTHTRVDEKTQRWLHPCRFKDIATFTELTDRERFELSIPLPVCRFSRPVHSTALPPVLTRPRQHTAKSRKARALKASRYQ